MPGQSTLRRFTLLAAGLIVATGFSAPSVLAQSDERWFQIEISIFSNESPSDRDEEQWQADRLTLRYPKPIQRLRQASDLLLVEDWFVEEAEQAETPILENALEIELQSSPTLEPLILATAPRPATPGSGFRFFDFQRDALVQLPLKESDFQQTNRAIQRAEDHRLLFHGLWRQPLQDPPQAIPIYLEGGRQYGEQHELQGTVNLHFNDNRDRITIDTNLWLAEFGAAIDPNGDWQLPEIPAQMKAENRVKSLSLESSTQPTGGQFNYAINRVFHLQQSREMRSTEFHYIDHPALGVVILVEPYAVPAIPLAEFDVENSQ
jgi:hypothetical protein